LITSVRALEPTTRACIAARQRIARDRSAGDCRVTRERTVTPSGRVIVRTHKVCD